MKFTVDSNHRDYFQKNNAIEFDSVLTENQLKILTEQIQRALTVRLEGERVSPENLFKAGRDLFRTDTGIKKIITQKHFAEIVFELTQQKPLRLGYDQFFHSSSTSPALNPNQSPYVQLLNSKPTLQEMSSLQGVLCGLMICLKAEEGEEKDEEAPVIFSRKPGNAVFFNPTAILNFESLTSGNESSYLLIVYVSLASVYILNTVDPNTYMLKNYGYSLGDRLSDKLNPIILR
jgi:hypothetical protein